MCEVRVSGISYVGAGNSTNKKDAEKNAARDFVNFLVRSGQIDANEVPANAIEQGGALPARAAPSETVPVFQVCIVKMTLFLMILIAFHQHFNFVLYSRVKDPKMLDKHIVE